MAIRIKSLLVSGPVVIPLNSGATVRLSPGQTSDELPDVEVTDSQKVAKLTGRGVIAVETDDADEAEPEDKTSKADGGGRTSTRKRRTTSE
jgi:hypothetical protein